jgi:hypothetical protein
MAEKILFEEYRDKTGLAGGDLQRSRKYQALKKRKGDVLDKVYESMANLVFFFEAVNSNVMLDAEFRKEMIELVGLNHLFEDQPNVKVLTNALLLSPNVEEDIATDYRYRIGYLMYRQISQIFEHLVQEEFTSDTRAIVLSDLKRARAWIASLADKVNIREEVDPVSRRMITPDLSSVIEDKRKEFAEELAEEEKARKQADER